MSGVYLGWDQRITETHPPHFPGWGMYRAKKIKGKLVTEALALTKALAVRAGHSQPTGPLSNSWFRQRISRAASCWLLGNTAAVPGKAAQG